VTTNSFISFNAALKEMNELVVTCGRHAIGG